jgi:hypothetical protein
VLGPCPFAKHFASLHLFAHADARGEGKGIARAAPGFGQIARFARNFGYANRYAKLSGGGGSGRMIFYREICRVEHAGIVLSQWIQSNPFEYETLTPPVASRFSLTFTFPSGTYIAESSSLSDLPHLSKILNSDLPALVRSNPVAFARMVSSLDGQIASPLDPPTEWAKVFELYQASSDTVSAEEWAEFHAEYHAAQRAFETAFWPPSVEGDTLSWVANATGGRLIGVRLKLSEMRLEKEALY